MSKIRKTLRIGITTGDINGIGPELIIRAFEDARLKEMFTPIIYGSPKVMNIYRKVLSIEKFSYNIIESPNQAQPKKVSLIDCINMQDRVDIGQSNERGGKAALESLEAAVRDLKSGELDALITMPIDKQTIQSEKFAFPGHTEYLAKEFETKEYMMFMVSDVLRMGVVTGHIPLKDVVNQISTKGILEKIRIMDKTLRMDFNIERPTIAVLGINPHAGDNGLLGKEDKEKVERALEQATQEGYLALGPYPSDGFFGSGTYKKFDGVLAMYHDQGLIPFKLLAGWEGVNFTAGLPGVRVSPDHGVAYELAGKGEASLDSFIHAIYFAIDIFRRRHENLEVEENKFEGVGLQIGADEEEFPVD